MRNTNPTVLAALLALSAHACGDHGEGPAELGQITAALTESIDAFPIKLWPYISTARLFEGVMTGTLSRERALTEARLYAVELVSSQKPGVNPGLASRLKLLEGDLAFEYVLVQTCLKSAGRQFGSGEEDPCPTKPRRPFPRAEVIDVSRHRSAVLRSEIDRVYRPAYAERLRVEQLLGRHRAAVDALLGDPDPEPSRVR